MQQSPARHALHERSINTSMNAINSDLATKSNTGLTGVKRRINSVDSPEYPPSPLRFRITQDSPKKDRQRGVPVTETLQKVRMPKAGKVQSYTDRLQEAAMTTVDMEDDLEEGDSQETLRDSVSSSSQQTSATETLQVRSVASMVRRPTLQVPCANAY